MRKRPLTFITFSVVQSICGINANVMVMNVSFCPPQSDREKLEGLPVAPFMDREKVTKPTAQIGFIKFVLIPMFESVMKVRRYSCLIMTAS